MSRGWRRSHKTRARRARVRRSRSRSSGEPFDASGGLEHTALGRYTELSFGYFVRNWARHRAFYRQVRRRQGPDPVVTLVAFAFVVLFVLLLTGPLIAAWWRQL